MQVLRLLWRLGLAKGTLEQAGFVLLVMYPCLIIEGFKGDAHVAEQAFHPLG